MSNVTPNTPEVQAEDACKATVWFRACQSMEEVESHYEQHLNAARWEVLTLSDIRAVKNEYAALRRILKAVAA